MSLKQKIVQYLGKMTNDDWADNQDLSGSYRELFDYWKEQNVTEDDDRTEGELEDEFREEIVRDKIDDFYDKLSVEEDAHGIVLYRAMTVPDPDEFMFMLANQEYLSVGEDIFKGSGIYWTWDEDLAEAYWGKSGQKEVVLRASAPLESVDIERTVLANLSLSTSEENEITLKEGSRVLLTGVYYDNQWWDVDNVEGYIELVASKGQSGNLAENKKLANPKDISDRLDKLNDKLYDKIGNYKMKSKLTKKKKKSNIPGFGYYFKK